MVVSVTKFGPYFTSGSISFSQLRSNFAERGSGEMKASDLRRNTNIRDAEPIVPDSTENSSISTGSNLSLSQFRNSVKRYIATQSGTDDNSSYPSEPGFRMGRYDLNNRGIDWSGGQYYGPDGQGGGTTGNLTRNVQKYIKITGTCGSVTVDQPAAQLSPVPTVHNIRMEVYGNVYGCGGKGGGTSGAPPLDGGPGGTAINLGNVGENCSLFVGSSSRIWGGGAGGEKGRNGKNGTGGTCTARYDTGVHCQGNAAGSEKCTSGGSKCGGSWERCCIYQGRGCVVAGWRVICCYTYTVAGTLGGQGGNGGPGRGYNYQSGSLAGQPGQPGQPAAKCSDGSIAVGATPGEPGGTGGTGSLWGDLGGEAIPPNDLARPGEGGKAITKLDGSNRYDLTGSWNDTDKVKGSVFM